MYDRQARQADGGGARSGSGARGAAGSDESTMPGPKREAGPRAGARDAVEAGLEAASAGALQEVEWLEAPGREEVTARA